MLEGSEFQTVGAAMLKPREAKVVRTRGTDKRSFRLWTHNHNTPDSTVRDSRQK